MRKLVVNTFLTLDGVMQAPGGPEEDPTGGFTQGGWSVNYWDDMMEQEMGAFMGKPLDLLLGRKTYDIFAAHWPHIKPDHPDYAAAVALNNAKKYVASRTRTRVDWQNSTLIVGDVAEDVRKLKKQDGPEIQVHGSSNLLQTLIANGLIDEYHLLIFPLVVGRGKRLFGDGAIPAGLTCRQSKLSTTGVILATYEPAGEIKRGSFALEQPTEAELERRHALSVE